MLRVLRRAMNQQQSQVVNAWNQFIARHASDISAEPKVKQPLEDNPHYHKYADKLRKAKETSDSTKQGQSKLSQEESEVQKMKSIIEQADKKLESEQNPTLDGCGPQTTKSSAARTPSYVKARKLNDIVKIELLQKHTKDEIKDIWCQYFRNKKDCLFACIERNTYDVQRSNAHRYPLFVFPLPVIDPESVEPTPNYQNVLVQFHEDQVYFTPLIMYQQHGENAPPCLTVQYFTELANSKGIVLMEAEFDKQVFSSSEAQCLVNQLQIFYASLDAKRVELLHLFNFEPSAFDYQLIIKEFESLSVKS
jgi:ATP synthase F1 complex assembly factor 1